MKLERLQNLRTQAGLTRRELARRSGVSVHTIGQLERGETGASLHTVERLSVALGIPARELLKGE